MSTATPSQGPESVGLLSTNVPHANTSYRDDPELEQQMDGASMTHIPATQDHGADPVSPKDPTTMQISKPEGRQGDALGFGLVAGGASLLVVLTWSTIIRNEPKKLGFFAYHPPLQTLAIAAFAYGILTLQPTSQPKTKQAGLTRHQLIILGFAFPCIAVGTLVIFWNKVINEYPHFKTWHGTFGIIAIVWLFIQIALGAGSVWFGGAAFGGGVKAKSVWKYHRLSGYLLYPFFLLTAAIGGGYSTWMTEHTSDVARIFGYAIAPLAILVGLWSRARLSKMQFF